MSSRPGQQPPGLELDQRRRDEQELGGAVEVDALHLLDLGAEHVDDARERDLPEVDLFLEDEVEEEVERAFEDRRRDLVRHARRRSTRREITGRVVVPESPGRTRLAPVACAVMAQGVLGHQAHRRDAARQLPRRGPALGRRPAPARLAGRRAPRRDLLRRRPPRDDDALRPGRAHGDDPPARARCCWPPASTPTAACCSCRATCAPTPSSPGSSTASATFGELRRMTQFKEKSRGPGVGQRRPVRLPGADGRRHPPLRHRRSAGRRRPAPARRAHARHRDPVQPPLRRHVRGAEGDVPRRSARGSWTSRPDEEDVEVGRVAAGHDPRARRPEGDHEEDQVGGHRLRHRGAPRPRREARRLEPDRDLRRGHRSRRSPTSRRSSRAGSTARSRARSPTRWSSSCARCRSGTRELDADPAEVDRRLAIGADIAEAKAEQVLGRRDEGGRAAPAPRRCRRLLLSFQGSGSVRSAGQCWRPCTSPRSSPARATG